MIALQTQTRLRAAIEAAPRLRAAIEVAQHVRARLLARKAAREFGSACYGPDLGGLCGFASLQICARLEDLSPLCIGRFRVGRGCFERDDHCWIEVDDVIIDPTVRQFRRAGVFAGVEIFPRGHSQRWRYDIDDRGADAAAEIFVDWSRAGYFPESDQRVIRRLLREDAKAAKERK